MQKETGTNEHWYSRFPITSSQGDWDEVPNEIKCVSINKERKQKWKPDAY